MVKLNLLRLHNPKNLQKKSWGHSDLLKKHFAICYEFASIKRALEVEFPKTYAFPDDKTIFWALMHLEHLRNSGEG
jgi:hypothetical protein